MLGKNTLSFRLLCLLSIFLFASTSHGEIRSKYPREIHELFRDRLTKSSRTLRSEGVWSDWSPWSPCSRTCGGGVTIQTRECISRPADPRLNRGRRRRRLESNDVENHCVGLYKRYHLCNAQPCLMGRDFRAEQCAIFNSRPFRGRIYFWEPYTKAGECVLNCRAVGFGFYAQLNKTVWDGTPCPTPTTQTNRPAPKGTRGVCVSGVCKSVSTEGVIGAISPPRVPELCSECSAGCKSESRFFLVPMLPPGYSFVYTLPKGACRVTISQLKHTRNFIALRYPNGTYILNGPGQLSRLTEAQAAGTTFHYKRQDSQNFESISSKGPLQYPVDIMLLYHQPNPGIKYEYMIPADQVISALESRRTGKEMEAKRLERVFQGVSQQSDDARPRRRRRKSFVWKVVGTTPCSKTCGGGTNHNIVACVREHSQTAVLDRRCAISEKPFNETLWCNTLPCPRGQAPASVPHWGGTWTPCSATCGPGEQTRTPKCLQEKGSTTVVVHSSLCAGSMPITTRKCEIISCDPKDNELEQKPTAAQWHTGGWSQCSVTCASGQRSRSVTCSGQCRPQDKPPTTEACHGPPCPGSLTSHTSLTRHHQHHVTFTPSSVIASQPIERHPPSLPVSVSNWLVTDWSESCSEECGTGMQERWVACPGGECAHSSKPERTRACSSDRHCGGSWYTGPWGPCSDGCAGQAMQRREVLCIVHIRGQIRVVSNMTCPLLEKPVAEQSCIGECRPRWHTGEWGKCEPCTSATGVQRREVRCLDYHGRPATGCPGEVPISKRPCTCTDFRFREIAQAQDEPSFDGECVNTISNCMLIIQGRMCRLPAYYKQCCASCRRAQQSPYD